MSNQPKQYNVWLFVVLSALPLVAIYPFRKLKKVRLMVLLGIAVSASSYGVSFLMSFLGFPKTVAFSIPQLASIPVSIVIDGILVYNWTKTHNLKVMS